MARIKSLKYFGIQLLASILTLLIVVLLPFILLLVVGPILLTRQLVARHLAKILHPEFSKILTHRSTNFSLDELHAHTEYAILSDYVFEGNYALEPYRKRFFENVVNRKVGNGTNLKYPELKQYVVTWMNFKFWKNEDNFNINDHILLYNESRPPGSEEVVREEEFHKMRETLLNSPFPKGKSPWVVVLVHNYLPADPILKDRVKKDTPFSVMLLKVHHSLGDGYALKKLVTVDWCGNKEVEKSPGTGNKNLKGNEESEGNHLLECFTWSFQQIKGLFRSVIFPTRCIYEFTHLSVSLMRNKSSWSVSEEQRAPAVHAFTNLIPVSRIKWIKDQLGVSFTSVLFHVCSESMQKIMQKKGMAGAESVIANFPLPLPRHPDKLRNHMTHGAFTLPTSPEMTPSQRLEKIHKHYEQVKDSTLPFTVTCVTKLVGGMTIGIIRLMASGLVPPIAISNFPASLHDDWIVDGHKILSSYFNFGLLNIAGLGFSIASKGQDIKFGVTANSNILNSEDIKDFVELIEREIDIIEHEIIPQMVIVSGK